MSLVRLLPFLNLVGYGGGDGRGDVVTDANSSGIAIGKTQKVDEFEGGFTLKIDMWYMSSPYDQLEVPSRSSESSSAKI